MENYRPGIWWPMAIPTLGRSDRRENVVIETSVKSGTFYHNYKGIFSIVLLAICDAKYYFTLTFTWLSQTVP